MMYKIDPITGVTEVPDAAGASAAGKVPLSTQTGKTIAPSDPKPSKPSSVRWYELERYVPYRDQIAVLGFLVIVYGVSRLSVTGSVILFGAGLCFLGYLMGMSK